MAEGTEATHPAAGTGRREHPGTFKVQRFLERVEVIVLLGGLGSFVLSVVALGVLPAIELDRQIARTAPAALRPFSPLEARGRDVYAREGCVHCHSQFVRPLASDVRYFGNPSEAWEFRYDLPFLWGTRRIGPDLSRESGRRSDTWQYAHLYDPRSTVPESIMPSFPWLFSRAEDGRIVPTEEGQAVVAYLNRLGRGMREAGPQQPVELMGRGARSVR